MLKDAEGFIWAVWCKVPSFNKSVSQTLLCNNSSCQLFWKINCLSWIPVKQSALILWRKGELCSSSLKSGLTSFISLSVISLVHRENLPCAKSSTWTQRVSQLQGRGVVCYLFSQPTLIFMKDSESRRISSYTWTVASALPWTDLNQHNAKRVGVAPISVWRQVF